MKLEDLVPPVDLCKKIPAGEFEDSTLIWINGNVIVRVADIPNTFPPSMRKNIFPAPTLQEIVPEFKEFELWKNSIWGYTVVIRGWSGIGDNIAAEALKLYLKMKGIKA